MFSADCDKGPRVGGRKAPGPTEAEGTGSRTSGDNTGGGVREGPESIAKGAAAAISIEERGMGGGVAVWRAGGGAMGRMEGEATGVPGALRAMLPFPPWGGPDRGMAMGTLPGGLPEDTEAMWLVWVVTVAEEVVPL